MKGILGRKLGMTQSFTEEGVLLPITVLQAGPCVVMQRRTVETDGYRAVQLGLDDKKKHRTLSPERGHADKAGVKVQKFVREIRDMDPASVELGATVTVASFAVGELVDVQGISKGKGFAGPMKRHGLSCGPMSHGSKYHRGSGSLGAIDPARVFKSQTLPGRMGGKRVTAMSLRIVGIDEEKNLILVYGSVPGPRRGYVIIRSAALDWAARSTAK